LTERELICRELFAYQHYTVHIREQKHGKNGPPNAMDNIQTQYAEQK